MIVVGQVFVHADEDNVAAGNPLLVKHPGQDRVLLDRPHRNDQRRAAPFPVGGDDLRFQHFGQVLPDGRHVAEDADLDRRAFAEVRRGHCQIFRIHHQSTHHSITPVTPFPRYVVSLSTLPVMKSLFLSPTQ